MAAWSRHEPACLMTWIALRVLDETRKDFLSAEKLKVKSLQFWVSGAAPSVHRLRVRSTARAIDDVFRNELDCKYETGVTRQRALDALRDALTDGQKTLPELAEVCDASYRFWREV